MGSLNDLSPTNLLLVAGKLRVELLNGRLSNVFVLLYHHELLVDVETTISVMQVCLVLVELMLNHVLVVLSAESLH